jgi:UPF0716 family protein affecting phage T7 exclusion
MLNLRMLYILIDQRSVRTFMAIVTSLGFGVLLDILVFINLSLLIGPWVTLAIIAAITASGIAFMFPFVQKTGRRLLEAVDTGVFDDSTLSGYIAALISATFFVVPGLFNTLVGSLLLFRPLGLRAGNLVSSLAGINWQEAYEYLRLDRMTRDPAES